MSSFTFNKIRRNFLNKTLRTAAGAVATIGVYGAGLPLARAGFHGTTYSIAVNSTMQTGIYLDSRGNWKKKLQHYGTHYNNIRFGNQAKVNQLATAMRAGWAANNAAIAAVNGDTYPADISVIEHTSDGIYPTPANDPTIQNYVVAPMMKASAVATVNSNGAVVGTGQIVVPLAIKSRFIDQVNTGQVMVITGGIGVMWLGIDMAIYAGATTPFAIPGYAVAGVGLAIIGFSPWITEFLNTVPPSLDNSGYEPGGVPYYVPSTNTDSSTNVLPPTIDVPAPTSDITDWPGYMNGWGWQADVNGDSAFFDGYNDLGGYTESGSGSAGMPYLNWWL